MSRDNHMDNISTFEEPKSIQAQACAWLARLDGSSPSKADLQGFKQWVNENPEHITAFEKVAAAWGELNILARLPAELQQREVRKIKTTQPVFTFRFAALTATLLLCVFLATQQTIHPPQLASYATAVGEQKTITLPDNSVVQLNTNSRIKFDYTGPIRAIYLYQGEVHFDVAKNPERPFEVYVGVGRVRAVGTAFTVTLNNHTNDIGVIVTEGVVEIAPEISAIPKQPSTANTTLAQISTDKDLTKNKRVSAGSAAVFNQQAVGTIELVDQKELQRRLAWQKGLLIFSGEPLEEVVAQISRYTDTTIIIKSEQARNLRIGGQFQVADSRAMVSALEQGFGLTAEYATDSLVYLSYNKTTQ